MPSTLAEKIIARAAGRDRVEPGEILNCRVDLAMFHDSSGPRRLRPMLEELGAPIWDRDKVVVITDHYVPAADDESHHILELTRAWVHEHGVTRFHDAQGICHVVLPQKGYLKPGMFCVGGDSHSPTGGAFGVYMFGIGATEMAGVLVTGEIWLEVPQTIRYQFDGRLAHGVTAKDIMLMLLGRFGLSGAGYQAVEFAGEAVSALSIQERMTLTNLSAELGAQTALIAPDAVLFEFLRGTGARFDEAPLADWRSDEDARFGAAHRFDASTLEPMVAAPHSPANARAVSSFADVAIDVAYVGACTGAKLADLRMAAEILEGQKLASCVELRVAPASLLDLEQARAEGVLDILLDAGATLLPSACGLCAGYGAARLAAGQTAISSTARNFKGRMGDADSRVYLASPYTVAASALTGRITDPRAVLKARE